MADLVNEARQEQGLAPLQLELDLNEAAEDHSSWMLAQNVFSHTGVGGSSAGARMQDAGFTFSGSWSWGENIAVQSERGAPGFADDVDDLFESLWNSPGHRANMLNPNFDYIGIGVEVGNFTFSQGTFYSVIVTQKFARTDASVRLDSVNEPAGGDDPVPEEPAEPDPPQAAENPTPPPGSPGNGTITGTNGNDILIGSNGSSELNGRRGDDILFGDTYGGNAYDTASGQIVRLYKAALDRDPDDPGHAFWTKALLDGNPLSQIAIGFLNSTEFQQAYSGLTDQAFVALLYNNVLDRAPDAGGEAYWLGQLDSSAMTRAEVVVGFSESAEFVEIMLPTALQFSAAEAIADNSDDVVRLYQATLDRLPDAGGFSYWTDILVNGMDFLSAVEGFVNSAEFQSVYGSLSNSQFVTVLYNNVLDRAPDAGGAAYWEGVLNNGSMSRAQVVEGFAQSQEFIDNMVPIVETYMEASGTDDVLDGGAGDDLFVGGVGADEFHFSFSEGGDDTIADFEMWDTIVLEGFGLGSSVAAAAAFVQDGGDAVYDHANGEIRLVDVVATDLTADEFQIA